MQTNELMKNWYVEKDVLVSMVSFGFDIKEALLIVSYAIQSDKTISEAYSSLYGKNMQLDAENK